MGMRTTLIAAIITVLFLFSVPVVAQMATQQGATTTPAQPRMPYKSPPLERHITSLSEDGAHQLDIVYHQNQTFELVADGKWPNHGTWRVNNGQFCFTMAEGERAGKEDCKNGRLIGRVAYDGTRLNDPVPGTKLQLAGPTCTGYDKGCYDWCDRYNPIGECRYECKFRMKNCMETGQYVTNHGTFIVRRE
jgi:hypothetical protein